MKERVGEALRSQVIGPFLIMLIVAAGVAISTDRFLLSQNLKNVALQAAIVAIVAIGATIVILTAQIDLSSGSLVALTTVLLADLVKNAGVSVAVAAILMILMGAGLGFVNGFFSSYGRIPSFIFTLGTLSIFRGLAFLDTGGTPIFSVSSARSDLLRRTPRSTAPVRVRRRPVRPRLGVPDVHPRGSPDLCRRRQRSAARLSGINVSRVRTEAFVIAGALAAVGGVADHCPARLRSPNYGLGMELMAIASAVIGGASLFGGQGNVFATLFGAFTIVIVQNGLNLRCPVGVAEHHVGGDHRPRSRCRHVARRPGPAHPSALVGSPTRRRSRRCPVRDPGEDRIHSRT